MTDKEKLKKVQDFVKEEFFHHASRDFYNQCCVSYNYTELTAFAKSIMELLQEEPVSKDLMEAAKQCAERKSYLSLRKGELVETYNLSAKESFIEGANWQKKRLPKWKKTKDQDGLYWSIDEATIVFKGYALDLTELEDVLEKED